MVSDSLYFIRTYIGFPYQEIFPFAVLICLGHIKCQGKIPLLSVLHVPININVTLIYILKTQRIRRCPWNYLNMHFDIYVPKKTVNLTMYMYFEFHLRN